MLRRWHTRWDPHGIVVQEELEKVQNHAPKFVTGNYNFETGSMTSILEQLGWESLHKRCKGTKLILLFKGLKGRASIPCDDLQPPNKCSRNQHPMAFQVPYTRTDIYKYSFFPDTIRDWNALPAAVISSAEIVIMFKPLVNFCTPRHQNICIFAIKYVFWMEDDSFVIPVFILINREFILMTCVFDIKLLLALNLS